MSGKAPSVQTTVVFDTSAVICLLELEPGAEVVQSYIGNENNHFRCVMSSVNLTEVLSRLLDGGLTPEQCADTLLPLGIEILPYNEILGAMAGWLREDSRKIGLSLGDRACLATAQQLKDTHPTIVLTADQIWSKLAIGIDIIQIRPNKN